ncbi:rna-binding domain protein [Stylonychia lemnae]|uniref:Rna-binding domain protein n=1 Tax=Stylonychia lemnae TaxID=5949 RepID=A0A078ADG0_STYLE|nr:rna-binding domain protein [Stylonychia lemnae]|eukprot:CDW79577.1 rna-binding domain protein [Stylonychia lemnae]
MKHLISKQQQYTFALLRGNNRQSISQTFQRGLYQSRLFSSKIFAEGLPTDWTQQEIAQYYGVVGEITQVNLVKNTMGQNTGKAIVTFSKDQAQKAAVQKFNNFAVNNIITIVKPYFESKDQISPRNVPSLIKRRLYLMNVPYDAHAKEVENLVKEFAQVDEVILPKDKSGRPRGYAFVYLKDAKDVDKAIEYVDGRHIRGRQIRAQSASDVKDIDSFLSYVRFVRRAFLTQVHDSKYFNEDNSKSNQMYLQQMQDSLILYSQENQVTIEESTQILLRDFGQIEQQQFAEQLEKFIEESKKQIQQNEEKWSEEERQKYPTLYFAEKLQEQINSSLGMPKEILYPPKREQFKPMVNGQISIGEIV